MDKLLPWLKEKKTENNKKLFEKNGSQNTATESVSHVIVVDPKVEEFFKDFPSPYREKVVQRFSKREGLNKLDFFRDMAMHYEIKCAMQGVFLEDQREARELESQAKPQEQETEEMMEKPNIELSEWEKKLLPYVPIKSGDTVYFKLSQSINLSLIGVAIMWLALSHRKQYSRAAFAARLFLGTGGFISSQVLAVQRFQDVGIFEKDSEKPNLNIIENAVDEVKDVVKIIMNRLAEYSEKTSSNDRK